MTSAVTFVEAGIVIALSLIYAMGVALVAVSLFEAFSREGDSDTATGFAAVNAALLGAIWPIALGALPVVALAWAIGRAVRWVRR